MAEAQLGAYPQLLDARDTSTVPTGIIGNRWSNANASFMAVSASTSLAGFSIVKFSGTTVGNVIMCDATSDLCAGVVSSSASVAAGGTTVVVTQGTATVLLKTGVASQAADIGLVPTATAGQANTIVGVATTAIPQVTFGHLLVSALSTGAGSTGTAYVRCINC